MAALSESTEIRKCKTRQGGKPISRTSTCTSLDWLKRARLFLFTSAGRYSPRLQMSSTLTFCISKEHFPNQKLCSTASSQSSALTGWLLSPVVNFFIQSLQRAESQSRQLITQQTLCHWQKEIHFDKLFRDAYRLLTIHSGGKSCPSV